jgi:hypothetical protein
MFATTLPAPADLKALGNEPGSIMRVGDDPMEIYVGGPNGIVILFHGIDFSQMSDDEVIEWVKTKGVDLIAAE